MAVSGSDAIGAALIALGAWWIAGCASGGGAPPGANPAREGPAAEAAGETPIAYAALPEPGAATRSPDSRRGLDVRRYDLALDVRGLREGTLRGRARLEVVLAPGLRTIPLDLVGLAVDSVLLDGRAVGFAHDGAILRVGPLGDDDSEAGGATALEVFYGGAPRDGLFFGRDGRGEPTAFADNWPNRARWWFPSNDHPSDKAAVRWAVRVPDGYEVIANGTFRGVEAAPEGGGGRVWRWESDPEAPIPTYTMVIGVARFGERSVGEAACGHAPAAPSSCADVTVWPLAGDSAYAVERFARAPDMLDFYAGLVAPYPYEKLAHVESSTRFGGMENASAIFYSMAPWAAREMGEGVIAHETAHQWFGDAVTPASWSHLWVSEGFASYFGPLYFGARDGEAAFRDLMEAARRAIVESDATARPVVHDTTDLFALLDTNNYQKGAWVLHMLRGLLGDSTFFRGIRAYYESSAHGTASTDDVRAALEAASGRDLEWFFEQWLYLPGYPRLVVEWWVEPGDGARAGGAAPVEPAPGGTLVVAVRQTQPESWPTFRLPTELEVRPPGRGAPVRHPVELTGRADTIRVAVAAPVEAVALDPDGWVLTTLDIRRRP